MTRRFARHFVPTLVGALALVLLGTICAQKCPAAEPSSSESANTDAAASGVNLALVAEPSSSYVSGNASLAALNEGIEPENSRDRRHGTYGNWPKRGTQWVQYEWSQPIITRKTDVYYWDYGRGIRLPKAYRVLYWDGSGFVQVSNPAGLSAAENQYNTTTFDEVCTSKLRLEVDGQGNFSTGILEWKVYDTGKSPDFPPAVTAGVDRVVVLGGKTYLDGEFKSLRKKSVPAAATWSKASGPAMSSCIASQRAEAAPAETPVATIRSGSMFQSLALWRRDCTARAAA